MVATVYSSSFPQKIFYIIVKAVLWRVQHDELVLMLPLINPILKTPSESLQGMEKKARVIDREDGDDQVFLSVDFLAVGILTIVRLFRASAFSFYNACVVALNRLRFLEEACVDVYQYTLSRSKI